MQTCTPLHSAAWLCASAVALALMALGCGDDSAGDEPDQGTPDGGTADGGTDGGSGDLPARDWECLLDGDASADEAPDSAPELGCKADFDLLASEPLSASIPGARSVKTVIDTFDDERLHFQNSKRYKIHWDFASAQLSAPALPLVPELAQFNQTEYYAPDRRFVLGAVTHYEEPDRWVYEIAPYDTASAEMIERAMTLIEQHAFFGEELAFHPTSDNVQREADKLPASIDVVTTDELFEDIRYQPLNLGESIGRVRFLTADELETTYVGFREIVVLDRVPNDISTVMGIITEEFQTPLSHINVLSQNRGTPNMGLKGAFDDPELRTYDGEWVRFRVGASEYSMEVVDVEEADAWWEEHRPDPVQVTPARRDVTELTDIEQVLDLESLPLAEALPEAIPAYGGKASHFGALAQIGEDVPYPKAFAVPVHYYFQHIEENGIDLMIEQMLADPVFRDDPAERDLQLGALRAAIEAAPVNAAFEALLMAKLEAEYTDVRMRFRSSTNAEDLNGFTGAGLYTSKSGDPNDPMRPILQAVRDVWASLWRFRAFEERSFRSIPHEEIGMALLVHQSFPDEEANGVAITNNIFDPTGLDPAFYVNVQVGEFSVVLPDPGVTTEQFLVHFERPGQPVVYLARSNLVMEGETVLTNAQIRDLGTALAAIHRYFAVAYGPGAPGYLGYYAMDVEFKFDGEPGEEPALFVKQARPYPGRGSLIGDPEEAAE